MTSKSQKAPVFLLDGTGSASPILDDRLATSVQRVLNNIKALDFHTAHQVIPNYAMFYPTPEEHDVIYEKFGDQLVMAVDGSVAIASARERLYAAGMQLFGPYAGPHSMSSAIVYQEHVGGKKEMHIYPSTDRGLSEFVRIKRKDLTLDKLKNVFPQITWKLCEKTGNIYFEDVKGVVLQVAEALKYFGIRSTVQTSLSEHEYSLTIDTTDFFVMKKLYEATSAMPDNFRLTSFEMSELCTCN